MKEFSYRIPDYRPHELPIQLLDDGREFVSIDDLNYQSIVFLVVLGDGWSCGPLGLFGPSIRESGLSAGQIKTIERARWRHRAAFGFRSNLEGRSLPRTAVGTQVCAREILRQAR